MRLKKRERIDLGCMDQSLEKLAEHRSFLGFFEEEIVKYIMVRDGIITIPILPIEYHKMFKLEL